MTPDNDWISLPSVIYRKIGDYCAAKDVLAWASTCRTVKTQLNLSVLRPSYELIYSQHYSASPLQSALSIPIFFPNHCHSVCVTCQRSDPGTPQESARIYIVARPKSSAHVATTKIKTEGTTPSDQASSSSPTTTTASTNNNSNTKTKTSKQRWIQDHQGNRAMIVWESQPRPPWIHIHELVMDATWNHDPNLDYFLWYSCPIYLLMEHFQIQALLVWEDDPPGGTRYRQATYSHCMALEALEQEELFSSRVEPNDAFGGTPDYQAPVHTMVAQLFTATIDTLSKRLEFDQSQPTPTTTSSTTTPMTPPPPPTSSTILQRPFQSIASNSNLDNLQKLLKRLKIMANIYEQLVEQREPQYCSIFPFPSHQQSETSNSNSNNGNNTNNHGPGHSRRLVTLPWIPLKTEFGWVPQEYLKEIPRFVARIPVAPNTQRLHLQAQRRGTQYSYRGHGTCTFFLFAQTMTMGNHPPTATTSGSTSPTFNASTLSSSNSTTPHTDGTNLWKLGDSIYCRRHLFILSETATNLDISIAVEDPHDVQAYYLYVVPDKTTMEEFSGLQVQLQVLEWEEHDNDYHDNDHQNHHHNLNMEEEDLDNNKDNTVDYSLSRVMELFLDPLRAHESSMALSSWEQGISFPLQLLKATALTLLLDDDCQCDGTTTNKNNDDRNLALVSFLKKHGLSTTPSGLACIVELIDAIASQKKSSFGHDMMNPDHDHQPDHPHEDLIMRTFRAM